MLSWDNLQPVAAFHLNMGTGVITGRGAVSPAVRTVGVGAGSWVVTLETPVNSTEAIVLIQAKGATIIGGNTLATHNLVDTSDQTKTIEAVLEGAGGTASALADVNCDVMIFRIQ